MNRENINGSYNNDNNNNNFTGIQAWDYYVKTFGLHSNSRSMNTQGPTQR